MAFLLWHIGVRGRGKDGGDPLWLAKAGHAMGRPSMRALDDGQWQW
jgi:hypothetical protein